MISEKCFIFAFAMFLFLDSGGGKAYPLGRSKGALDRIQGALIYFLYLSIHKGVC